MFLQMISYNYAEKTDFLVDIWSKGGGSHLYSACSLLGSCTLLSLFMITVLKDELMGLVIASNLVDQETYNQIVYSMNNFQIKQEFLVYRKTAVCMCAFFMLLCFCLMVFVFPCHLFVFVNTLPFRLFTQMLSFNLFQM